MYINIITNRVFIHKIALFQETVLLREPVYIPGASIDENFIDGPDLSAAGLASPPKPWPTASGPNKRSTLEFTEDSLGERAEIEFSSTIDGNSHMLYPGGSLEVHTQGVNSLERRDAGDGIVTMGIEGDYMWRTHCTLEMAAAAKEPEGWDPEMPSEDMEERDDWTTWWHKSEGTGAVVYVIDTGLDMNHEAFDGIPNKEFDGGPYMWSGPYPEPWIKQDRDNHGTQVMAKIAGYAGNFANNATLKSIKIRQEYNWGSSFIATVSVLDAFVKIYEDIISNHGQAPIIINLSLGLTFSKMKKKRIQTTWYELAFREILRMIKNLGNVVITISAGNKSPNVPIAKFPTILAEEDEFKDFVIVVGGVNKHDRQNQFQTADYMKIWSFATGIGVPVFGDKKKWNRVHGTSFAAPAVAGMLAYFTGLGMTIKQAVHALYEYAYDRRDPKKFNETPAPVVIYNGFHGVDGGGWSLDQPRTHKGWDKFFRDKKAADAKMNDAKEGDAKKDDAKVDAAKVDESKKINKKKNNTKKNKGKKNIKKKIFLKRNNAKKDDAKMDDVEIDAKPLPVDVSNHVHNAGDKVVLEQKLSHYPNLASSTSSSSRPSPVDSSINPSITSSASPNLSSKTPINLTGPKSGQGVALSNLVPSSLDLKTHSAKIVLTNSTMATDESFLIPSSTSAFNISQPTSAMTILTGSWWKPTVTQSRVEPPLSWSTNLTTPLIKYPSTLHRSTITLTAEAPEDSTVN
ncbi:hypothetical protein TWF506_009085 [Arthrobotrys conoides]|uniref:Peptidase S8/S53 domain-containing protein n=1 Tax=Arthrobotrys conoides TaxID=74498 RepID=A0AAN8RXG8_9PEZI